MLNSHLPGISIPKTIAAFEKSKWVKEINMPDVQERLLRELPAFLRKLGNSDVAKRAAQALELFNASRANNPNFWNARNVLILGAALLYLVSPLDCIPDIIPVVGWLDDIGVLALVVKFVMACMDNAPNPEEVAAAEASAELEKAELALISVEKGDAESAE